jgi:hypothetical protein
LVGPGVHVPFDPVRVCPDCAVPEIEGSGETLNVPGGGGAAGPGTTAVCAEVAEVEPFLFVAKTTMRNVDPGSRLATVYDDADTPSGAQAAPEASQRCHEIEKVGDGPAHAPGLADSCPSTTADPEIDGSVVAFGADLPGPAAEETATGMQARHRKRNALRWGDWRRRSWSWRLKRRVLDIPPAIGGFPLPVFP